MPLPARRSRGCAISVQILESMRAAMVQFMWQADLQGSANYVTDCPEV